MGARGRFHNGGRGGEDSGAVLFLTAAVIDPRPFFLDDYEKTGDTTVPKQPDVLRNMQKEERRRSLRRVTKRNRQERLPRRRDWMDSLGEDHGYERVMPRGERERRRAVEALMASAPEQAPAAEREPKRGLRGQVIEVSAGLCRVKAGRITLLCSLRGSMSAAETGYTNVVAVGDRVVVQEDGSGQGVVEEVLPRRNQIARPDPFYTHLRQVLVANVDQLLVVASWRDPHFWPELVDRYLIAAERSGVTPVLCVNKVDLADSLAEVNQTIAPYRELAYQVILTSAETGYNLPGLRELLANKVTALAGLSGVGKSSLLSGIYPTLDLRVGEVNQERHQGRHTTSQVRMLSLGSGGAVIDTPGIREFGLAGLQGADLIAYYPELREAAARCRFSDCSHAHEPGCAVREGAAQGRISAVRLDSYLKIRASLPAGG